VGDIFWAKARGHTWWPCMITSYPPPMSDLHIGSKIPDTVKSDKKMFCVLFFGPRKEWAWIPDSNFIPYNGNFNFNQIYKSNQIKFVVKFSKLELNCTFKLLFAIHPPHLRVNREWDGRLMVIYIYV
jgi:hypothetical protein